MIFAHYRLATYTSSCVIATTVRIYYFLQLAPVTDNMVLKMKSPETAEGKGSQSVICCMFLILLVISDAATLWIHIECSASIITACLPILVPVVTKMKALTSSLANSFSRMTNSKASTASQSSDSFDVKSPKLSGNYEKNSSYDLGARDTSGQIKATTVVSVT